MSLLDIIAATMLLAGSHAAGTGTAELRITPSAPVYAQSLANGRTDVMLQNITIVNPSESPRRLEALRIEFLSGGSVTASHAVDTAEIVADSIELAAMADGPAMFFARSQLLSEGDPEGFGDTGSIDAVLASGEQLVSTANYFTIDPSTDIVRVTALLVGTDGQAYTARTESPIVLAPLRRRYAMPLAGTWNMRGLPGPRSHHRRIPSNEFALDFFKLGADGRLAMNDGLIAEDNFGYGEPVLAAADGVVVSVIADATQDRSVFRVREGETPEQARRRAGAYQTDRMRADIRSALAGNLVTIRHDFPDGTTEYSSYGHLAAGSVLVAPGDVVTRGEPIAAVGDTGDSATVHLHFQVNAGADPFLSRSLPFAFDNMQETFGGQDAGIFVRSAR